MALLSLTIAACGGGADDNRRPQRAGKPLDPAETTARMAAANLAAATGNQDAYARQVEAISDDIRRSIKLADPARAVDRESARQAARSVAGVRSVVWLDAHNLFVIVEENHHRSHAQIDAICLELEPLGDTLDVVVNLQSGAARTGDELEILSRNCQLAPGDRAFLQPHRKIDVIDPEIRRQHRAN